ncbi:hypothetical protein CKO45_00030 [Paracraurococcus ruber]|uniref:Flagellar hook-length control protein-like C-terminal domain-containing protein n=1 Tax=Paracraurococcus ruber TaxID=77675 RepID=A0ABS1CQI9_9PROT|nr:hypothetical protein [Paracraurococcus ruber]
MPAVTPALGVPPAKGLPQAPRPVLPPADLFAEAGVPAMRGAVPLQSPAPDAASVPGSPSDPAPPDKVATIDKPEATAGSPAPAAAPLPAQGQIASRQAAPGQATPPSARADRNAKLLQPSLLERRIARPGPEPAEPTGPALPLVAAPPPAAVPRDAETPASPPPSALSAVADRVPDPAPATAIAGPAPALPRPEATPRSTPDVQAMPVPPRLMAEAGHQVALRVARAAEHRIETISVDLRPPELGRVEVRLSFRDGAVHQVVVAADRPETFQSFSQDRSQLEQQLARAGIELGAGGLDLRQGDGGRPEAEARPPAGSPGFAAAEDTAEPPVAQRLRALDSLIDIIA